MVRFNERLEANIVPEWADKYLDYGMLKKPMERKRTTEGRGGDLRATLLQRRSGAACVESADSFVHAVESEARKVDAFYTDTLRKAHKDWQVLREELLALQGADASDAGRDEVQERVRALYRTVTQLRNFCIINYTGFTKITKKFRKTWAADEAQQEADHAMDFVERCAFSGDKRGEVSCAALDSFIEEVERIYSGALCGGRVEEARVQLLTRRWRPTDWRTFNRGLNVGIMLQLLLWVTWAVFMESNILRSPTWQRVHTSSEWMVVQLPIYRGIGCLTLAIWGWATCLYCWECVRVNYLYIFEFDERSTLRHSEVFDRATLWTQWFLANFLLFFKSLHGVNPMPVSAAVFPLLLYGSVVALVACSTPGRLTFIAGTLFRIIAAPFAPVNFWYSFAADALTSLVQPMTDLAYSTCYFGTGEWLRPREEQGGCEASPFAQNLVTPLCAALPLWWRLCQNLRQYHSTHTRFPWLANALKYAASLTVVVFGVFHPDMRRRGGFTAYKVAYLFAFCGSTLYSFTWDIMVDWSLVLIRWPRGQWLPSVRLRPNRMYSGRALYCVAIVLDLFLRFLWTTTLIPSERMLEQMPTFIAAVSPFTAAAEVFRRAMWSVLRVESEHLHTEGFRRVALVPLHFDVGRSRRDKPSMQEQQLRSKLVVIGEILVFAVVVVLLAVTAILTRTRDERLNHHDTD
mmetsp:Transcript_3784/g.12628  ORF Transcript_3784/g.12628 Transcript_3784/m.12628 type:complete len:689 (-) Transcript_3784:201-2267(-)